jgi:TRAP-type C4-dicarboxylate transport system substrate-binding protein
MTIARQPAPSAPRPAAKSAIAAALDTDPYVVRGVDRAAATDTDAAANITVAATTTNRARPDRRAGWATPATPRLWHAPQAIELWPATCAVDRNFRDRREAAALLFDAPLVHRWRKEPIMNLTRRITPLLAVAAVMLNACVSGGETTKAGGDAEPVTLRLRAEGLAVAGGQAEEFARQVEERSGHEIRVEPVFDFVPDDQIVAAVSSGEFDLGLTAARAWDLEGVDTMRALHAPFLVTSDTLMDRVVTDDALSGEMLAGLEPIGVTGLALLPDGVRHVFSFGEPLLSPDDFEGITVRALPSASIYAVLEALGARPEMVDVTQANVADGTLGAIESSFGVLPGLNLPVPLSTTSVVGNVTPFPRINTLFVNTDVLEDLTGHQQDVLRDAAIATRDWAVDNNVDDAQLSEAYCAAGGTIVLAEESQVEAFRVATQAVYDELEQNDATAAMIDRIRDLADGVAADPVAPCAPAAIPESTVPPPDTTEPSESGTALKLDGLYRFEFTEQELLDAGIAAQFAGFSYGRHTLGLSDGEFYDELGGAPCRGTYEIEADRVTFRWDPTPNPGDDPCTGDWAATATVDAGQITWTDVAALPPFDRPEDQLFYEVVYGSPWTRIGDVEDSDIEFVTTSIV